LPENFQKYVISMLFTLTQFADKIKATKTENNFAYFWFFAVLYPAGQRGTLLGPIQLF